MELVLLVKALALDEEWVLVVRVLGFVRAEGLGQRLRRERFISPKNELAALEKEKVIFIQELEIIKEEIEFLKADK